MPKRVSLTEEEYRQKWLKWNKKSRLEKIFDTGPKMSRFKAALYASRNAERNDLISSLKEFDKRFAETRHDEAQYWIHRATFVNRIKEIETLMADADADVKEN